MPVDAAHQLLGLFRQARQLVQVGPEDSHGQVRRCAAQTLVDSHPERRREQHGDTRAGLRAARACRLQSPRGCASRSGFSTTSTSDTVWGIGSSVRSARPVRRTTSSTSGTSRKQVFDAMIQPIDFVERCLGRQHGLQEKRAFVELRHEVAADDEGQATMRGDQRSASVTTTTSSDDAGSRPAPVRTIA